jgi:hypothetical protein
MGQFAAKTAPLANWLGGDDNHAFRLVGWKTVALDLVVWFAEERDL